ncbi:MAG: ABC transporter substrate-binding protein [Ilumatobacteraceae bacterium]
MKRTPFIAGLVAVALLAACSSGDKKSIVDAGNTPTTMASSTTGASTTAGSSTTGAGSSVPGSVGTPTTGAGPTTTAQADISALPACPTTALDSASGTVDITVWDGFNAGAPQTEFQKLVDQYNASQSKVHVEALVQGEYEDVIAKYLQAGKGDLPDLVQMPEYMTQTMIDTKQSVPVEACIRADGYDTSPFIDGALLAWNVGNVQWGMPFNVSDPVLFYNRKVFTAAGLDPDKPPASIDEIREYSQKIIASGAAKYGLALDSGFDSGGGWYLEQWFAQLGEFYADNDNGRTARATKVLYDDDTGIDLLTQVQQLVKDGLAMSVGDNATGFDNLLKLADAKEPAAMTINTSAALSTAIDTVKGGQFPQLTADDIGIGPLPGPNGAKGAIVGGAAMWMTDSGNDAKVAATWDFLKYITAAQQQSQFAADTGYIASRNDARDLDPLKSLLASDPRFAVAFDQLGLLAGQPTAAGPIIGPLREVRTVAATAVAQIFAGGDVKTALDSAAQQSDSLITDYNARN